MHSKKSPFKIVNCRNFPKHSFNRILDSADSLQVYSSGTRDECFEHCKNNIYCFQAEWYPKVPKIEQIGNEEINHPICYLFPVGSMRREGSWLETLLRRHLPGSSIIRCKEKQCHPTASSANWNGCQPGKRGAFCALSDEKISWPDQESTNEFNQISRCKQCPKIGPKKEKGHNNIEWGKPYNCLQARVASVNALLDFDQL